MRKTRLQMLLPVLVASIALALMALLCMLFFLEQATIRAREHAQEVLMDSTTQQITVLNARIQGRFALLEALAGSLPARQTWEPMDMMRRVRAVQQSSTFRQVSIATPDGRVYTEDGFGVVAVAKQVVQASGADAREIAWIKADALEQKSRLILSVPMEWDGVVTGIVSGSEDEAGLRAMLQNEAYDGAAVSFLCDQNGGALLVGDPERFLCAEHWIELQDGIKARETGIIFCPIDGDRRYAAYQPMGINDWYLVSVVPGKILAREVAQTIKSAMAVMAISAAFSILAILLIVLWNDRQNKRLRISEAEYRVVAEQGGKMIFRYDLQTRTVYSTQAAAEAFGIPLVMGDMPEFLLRTNRIADVSLEAFMQYYGAMRRGEKTGSTDFCLLSENAGYRWYHSDFTMIERNRGKPTHAVVSFADITERREKELAFNVWRKTADMLPPDKFRLIEHNLIKDYCIGITGSLFRSDFDAQMTGYDERTAYFLETQVYPEDADNYRNLLSRERFITAYHEGKKNIELDFRLLDLHRTPRWVRLSAKLLEDSESSDICAYMMFQDIDESKRREIALIERSERDTLTKAFNREAFMRRVDESIKRSGETDVHAFFMLDVDGFKTVNDLYGHGVGDETLTDIVRHMYSILRKEDLVGRMGGDEFAVFLKDASYDSIIEKRAQQICALMHRRIKEDTEISGSVGIAQFPRDGRSFVQLYHNADIALYAAKENGKNNYQFFQSNMQYPTDGHACTHTNTMAPLDAHTTETQCRKRLLIIDDAAPNRELCAAILKNEYVVRTAQNGETALAHLKRYGNSISVVLLSTWMDGMDGFAVLREIMCNQTLRSIPVIMFGQDKEEETALAAIELGAANFISAPIHAKRLRMCVQSAIRRGEQDKARLQNSYALLQEEEEARYRSVLTGTGTVVFEYDWINNVFTYDPLASQYLFGTYDDRPFWRILSTDGVADVEDVKAMQNCVLRISRDCNVQSDQMKVRLKAANACMHWFRMNVMRSSDVQGLMHKLLLIFNDINEEEIAQEKLRQRAERDPLTGLYNRETFLQKTRELLFAHGSKEYVVIYYDINRFKAINEMFGRTEGDAFLCHIARFMEKSLGKRGVCGRISADNFALCAPNEAAFLQEHLLKDCHAAFARYHLPFSITASFGVYVAEAPFISVDAMLDRAALAQKSVKKNYFVDVAYYNEKMRQEELLEQEIAGQMCNALEQNQFEMYFQPQYNHATHVMVGVEALARWNHPEKGLISPQAFIPLFEKNGFISKLDEYIWERACIFLRRRMDAGKTPLPISVNVSRVDIYNPALCETIMDIVQRHGILPALLKLEITESAYMENPDQLIATVFKLQDAGFTMEMDDFGSGYSSLNMLKDVPVDVVKLDMRFLSKSGNNERQIKIIKNTIRMICDLGLLVIAEGVETKEQADLLLEYGCKLVQGYYYARPMPAEEFDASYR